MPTNGAQQRGRDAACKYDRVVSKRSITFDVGYTHDLGPSCQTCHATEARCAYLNGCCATCTHPRASAAVQVSCPATNTILCRLRATVWAVLCLNCYQLTGSHRLASVAMTEHHIRHGHRPLVLPHRLEETA